MIKRLWGLLCLAAIAAFAINTSAGCNGANDSDAVTGGGGTGGTTSATTTTTTTTTGTGGDATGGGGEGGGIACGNNHCDQPTENCATCSADCGVCPAVCGNNVCEANEAQTCPQDCAPPPNCGNGTCNQQLGENCQTCPQDCGVCPTCGNGICGPGESFQTCPVDCKCGNSVCDNNETHGTCPQDCPAPPSCSDGTCNNGENCATCSADCGVCPAVCGNNVCEANEAQTCPQDCAAPSCGNGTCAANENHFSCPQDCALGCGDAVCAVNETNASCPADCAIGCGNNVCDASETFASCPHDCANPAICDNDGFCEAGQGETIQSCPADCHCGNGTCAANENHLSCPQDCAIGCGNNVCDASETFASCPADCAIGCGNNVCDASETFASCPHDCSAPPVCGNGQCQPGETCQSCAQDCGACGNVTQVICPDDKAFVFCDALPNGEVYQCPAQGAIIKCVQNPNVVLDDWKFCATSPQATSINLESGPVAKGTGLPDPQAVKAWRMSAQVLGNNACFHSFMPIANSPRWQPHFHAPQGQQPYDEWFPCAPVSAQAQGVTYNITTFKNGVKVLDYTNGTAMLEAAAPWDQQPPNGDGKEMISASWPGAYLVQGWLPTSSNCQAD